MAILSGTPGVKVTIAVQNRDLHEYKHDESDEVIEDEVESMIRYVEAFTDDLFSVVIEFDQPNFPFAQSNLSIRICIDGQPLVRRISEPYQRGRKYRPLRLDSVEERTEDGWARRYFRFAKLHIHEGEADKRLMKKIGDLGTIAVTFHRITFRMREPRPENNYNRKRHFNEEGPRPLIDGDEVSEKTLKGSAVDHQASFTEAVHHTKGPPPSHHTNRQIIDLDHGKPVASFTFRYRSRAALKILRLLPRTPSPTPLEDRAFEDLTPHEQYLIMKQKAEREDQEAYARSMKVEEAAFRQPDFVTDDDELEVTEERPTKRSRLLQGPNGQTIHLDDW